MEFPINQVIREMEVAAFFGGESFDRTKYEQDGLWSTANAEGQPLWFWRLVYDAECFLVVVTDPGDGGLVIEVFEFSEGITDIPEGLN